MITAEHYKKTFVGHANDILRERKEPGTFVIDDNNRELLNQIYYYMSRNLKHKFNGNSGKGILLTGKIGCGKSLIMNAFARTCKEIIGINIKFVHSVKLIENYAKRTEETKVISYEQIKRCRLIIDDLGKESNTTKSYGNNDLPMVFILENRYSIGTLTFATSNYKPETLGKHYGPRTYDIMRSMFNFIVLPGESRRK